MLKNTECKQRAFAKCSMSSPLFPIVDTISTVRTTMKRCNSVITAALRGCPETRNGNKYKRRAARLAAPQRQLRGSLPVGPP